MESAFGTEGEVRRAGQVGDRDEVAGDDASGYSSPAEGRDNRPLPVVSPFPLSTGTPPGPSTGTVEGYRRRKGTVKGVPVGQGAKGPDWFGATHCDRPGAPRRRQTAGQVGAV